MSADDRLAEKLSELKTLMPPPTAPKGVYKPLVVMGNMVFLSGHLPVRPSGELVVGRLGAELDVQAGYDAARLVGFGLLASLRKQFGTLDRVRRVIRLLGVVNSTPDFIHQPSVVNGCSELLAYVFGPDDGVGARSAIGAPTLPLGVPVEIEAVFEIEPPPV